MKYTIGRNDFALTIFVPSDCGNHCPFCTSKNSYKTLYANPEHILNTVEKLGAYRLPFKDVVITGGEPLRDLDFLTRLMSTVTAFIKPKNIYINTMLPQANIMKSIFYINNSPYISGISVSRHIRYPFAPDSTEFSAAPKDALFLINKPVRINCVLAGNETDKEIKDFYNKYRLCGKIMFRANYTTIDQNTLHSKDYEWFKRLNSLFTYNKSSGCNVCNTDSYEEDVYLHRGTETTSLVNEDTVEINDIVIKQDGYVYYDWDDTHRFTENVIKEVVESLREERARKTIVQLAQQQKEQARILVQKMNKTNKNYSYMNIDSDTCGGYVGDCGYTGGCGDEDDYEDIGDCGGASCG